MALKLTAKSHEITRVTVHAMESDVNGPKLRKNFGESAPQHSEEKLDTSTT